MPKVVVIAHNLRSAHNVGSLLRTADGLGVAKVFLTGYTPYPLRANDARLPHLAAKINKQIIKTALGAESSVAWEHTNDVHEVIQRLKADSYRIAALEQSQDSLPLPAFTTGDGPLALLIGREVEGIEPEILAACDLILEIPMVGQKESFNVVQAAAMALYQVTFSLHG